MRYFLTFVCIAIGHYAWSQTVCELSISGKVVSEDNRELMCYAPVYIKETGQGAITDADGFFHINAVCPGKYTLVCTHIGYLTRETEVEVKAAAITCNLYLEESAAELNGYSLEEHRDHTESSQQNVVLEGVELDKARGSTLGESLKKITGVYTLNTGNSISKPILHGMHSKRLLILNNGVRQEGQQWGQEHGPEIDAFVAKKITVVKGASSVQYGPDAIAGAILVEPAAIIAPPGTRGELYMTGNTNGWGGAGSLMLEGSFKKFQALSWRVQGSFRKAGDLQAANYGMANTAVQEYSISGGLGYYKARIGAEIFYSLYHTELGIFSGSHFGNITDLEHAISSPQPLVMRDFSYTINRPMQDITHHLVKGKFYVRTGSRGKLETTVAFQENIRKEYDSHKPYNDSLAALNKPALSFILQTVTADVHWEHSFHKKMRGSVGMSGLYQTNRWDGAYFIPNFRNVTGGLYWFENIKLGHWDLEAGLRYDISYLQAFMYKNNVYLKPAFFYQNIAANIGAIYHLNDHFTARVNYGLAWRPPHVSELYSYGLHHGSATFEMGDSSLQPERAHNFNVSFNLGFKRFKAEVTGYYYFIQDYIYLQPTLEPVQTIRGAFPGFQYTSANVDIKGVDIDLDIYITPRLLLNSKTSLLWAWNYSAKDYLINMPPFRFDNELSYTFKDAAWLKSPYLGINALYVAQQTMAPANADYMAPPPGYFLLGFNAGVEFMIRKVQSISLSVSVTNALNTPYRDYLNRFRYFTDDMGRNIVVKLKIPLEFNKYKTKKSNN